MSFDKIYFIVYSDFFTALQSSFNGRMHKTDPCDLVRRGPQPVHFHQRSVGVVRQVGIDLQTTTAIFTVRGVVERPERVGHAPDVALTEGFVDGRGALSLE